MTDKQKDTLFLITRLLKEGKINEEEFYTLHDFIFREKNSETKPQEVVYVPVAQPAESLVPPTIRYYQTFPPYETTSTMLGNHGENGRTVTDAKANKDAVQHTNGKEYYGN